MNAFTFNQIESIIIPVGSEYFNASPEIVDMDGLKVNGPDEKFYYGDWDIIWQ